MITTEGNSAFCDNDDQIEHLNSDLLGVGHRPTKSRVFKVAVNSNPFVYFFRGVTIVSLFTVSCYCFKCHSLLHFQVLVTCTFPIQPHVCIYIQVNPFAG